MSQSARVTSINALKELKVALCGFSLRAKEALCSIELEIRRTFDWLDQQLKHWQQEVRQQQEVVVRAKGELDQRKYGCADGRGYTEQEVALKKALERLRHAEAKVETTRRWIHVLPRAVTEYEGPGRQLGGMLDAELRHAVAILDQKIDSLEAYVTMVPPSLPTTAAAAEPVQQTEPRP